MLERYGLASSGLQVSLTDFPVAMRSKKVARSFRSIKGRLRAAGENGLPSAWLPRLLGATNVAISPEIAFPQKPIS